MIRSRFTLQLYKGFSQLVHFFSVSEKVKLSFEYLYWWNKKRKETTLTNFHYEAFFTSHFGLNKEFYQGKKILDIGCGPRGSLEWATQSETHGLDPLVNQYKKLGITEHKMNYIQANCENIPYENNYFDVVSSFNSLDHVDDLEKSISEIKRIIKPNGYFLLIADIHDNSTVCEPSPFSWDIAQKFIPEFDVVQENHYEGEKLYQSIREAIPYNHSNPEKRYGVYTALLKKRS